MKTKSKKQFCDKHINKSFNTDDYLKENKLSKNDIKNVCDAVDDDDDDDIHNDNCDDEEQLFNANEFKHLDKYQVNDSEYNYYCDKLQDKQKDKITRVNEKRNNGMWSLLTTVANKQNCTSYTLINKQCNDILQDSNFRQPKKSVVILRLIALGCFLLLIVALIASLITFLIYVSKLEESEFKGQAIDKYSLLYRALHPSSFNPNVSMVRFSVINSTNFVVYNRKCKVPDFNPWDKSIKGYISKNKPLDCKQIYREQSKKDDSTVLTYVKDNKLYFSKLALAKDATIIDDCCIQAFTRDSEDDAELLLTDECVQINARQLPGWSRPQIGLQVSHSFIKVICKRANYENVHAFVNPKHEVTKKLDEIAFAELKPNKHYNVLMLGLDTLSRLNSKRQINETLSIFKSLYNATEFYGYTKVGENTFPNIIPLLTGLTPEQLIETNCWSSSRYTRNSDSGDDVLDKCTFAWNLYEKNGYTTYYNEDWPSASTFNYLKKGFRNEPTTYYMRPIQIGRVHWIAKKENPTCVLNSPLAKLDFDLLNNFLRLHENRPYFALSWINMPQHDDLNGASTLDLIIKRFLKQVHEITQNKRTFVILFSDHGYRWRDFISTKIGGYESKLPMLNIALPKEFINEQPELSEIFRSHARTLLTPFDMFRFLYEILQLSKQRGVNFDDVERIKNARIETQPSSPVSQYVHIDGINYEREFKTLSLFKRYNQNELERSCTESGIPDNYCACKVHRPVLNSTLDTVGAALYLTHFLNLKLIDDEPNLCRILSLHQVLKAERFDFKHLDGSGSGKQPKFEYNVEIETIPGFGQFSETIRMHTSNALDCHKSVLEALHELELINKLRLAKTNEEHLMLANEKLFAEQELIDELPANAKKLKLADLNTLAIVHKMNKNCDYKIDSESISRLNWYGNQSKCVKHNIELKKVCLCAT